MNFVKARVRIGRIYRTQNICYFLLTIYVFSFLNGCSDKVTLPSAEQLIEFENAAPPCPVVDLDSLVKAKIGGGPYRVLSGEVLELTMPYILRVVATDESVSADKNTVYICRISDNGTITLPIVGQIDVAGKTLAQIESAIIDAYYPKYALTLPSVLARVLEYKTSKVSISGAVQKPGIYSLRSDQMSLIALIMEAGGIINEGAAVIRIVRSEKPIEPDSDNTPGSLTEQKIEQVAKSINTELNESPAYHPDTNDINVQLSFKQLSAQSTTGIVSIAYNGKVLLAEPVDIASEIERLVFLKQLSWKEPRVSTAEVERKFYALAESLKSGSGISRIEKDNTNGNINSYISVNQVRNENRVLHENSTEWSTQVFTAYETQQPSAMPELYKPSYGVFYDTNRENNMVSNMGFHTDDPKGNTTTSKAISKELNEILYMVTKQKKMTNGFQEPESIILPVKGYNIPFADVVLKDGDNVIVERLAQPLFTVMGLVNKPGNFQYPPNVQYNLIQALAFAGGLDPTAEPRYVIVYRLKQDGTIIHAAFEIVHVGNSSQLTDALNVHIKPGDIVSVEHTPRTRTKVFLDRVFRVNLGTYYSLNDAWND